MKPADVILKEKGIQLCDFASSSQYDAVISAINEAKRESITICSQSVMLEGVERNDLNIKILASKLSKLLNEIP